MQEGTVCTMGECMCVCRRGRSACIATRTYYGTCFSSVLTKFTVNSYSDKLGDDPNPPVGCGCHGADAAVSALSCCEVPVEPVII